MKIELSELLENLIICVVAVLITCAIISLLSNESNIKLIKHINGYDLVELEDGHQYLRSTGLYDHSLEHYVDCPKCKTNK